jgi:pimeloyl-ACP methyl ester carboxylesterase
MKILSRALIIFLALLIISFALWFIFFLQPEAAPGAAREKELLDLAADRDVIIIFNSGGWGKTPPKAASDFAPILAGIQDSLAQRGYSSLITPFIRTPRGLTGEIEDTKDLMGSFKYSSEALAREVEFIMNNSPSKKVIIAGLSNGGGLTERAMQRLAERPGIYAIVAGVPRWYQIYNSDRVLYLDNNGKDKLAVGDYRAIAAAVIKAPFKWLWAKIKHQNLSLALAIDITGHDYPWSSTEVGPPVVNFINTHFKVKKTQST